MENSTQITSVRPQTRTGGRGRGRWVQAGLLGKGEGMPGAEWAAGWKTSTVVLSTNIQSPHSEPVK